MKTSHTGLLVLALGASILLAARTSDAADRTPASDPSNRTVVVRAAPSLEPPRSLTRVTLPTVAPDESDRAIRNYAVPVGLNPHVATRARPGAKALEPPVPASIAELARALRNDVDLIYEHVRNNVEYYPVWGVQKGALGTLLDGSGTAFDQAALMVALLRQAGYTASFVKGRIALDAAALGAWLGVSTANACGVQSVLAAGRIPVAQLTSTGGGCTALSSAELDHLWVKVNIGGTNYHFDPSYKPHALKSGIDLAAASGYDATAYLNSAKAGATLTADYVQNINRANVRANLASLAGTLATHVRTNLPAGELADLVGGKSITAHAGGNLRQIDLPYRNASIAVTEYNDIPAGFKPTLRIQHGDIDATFTSDALYAARLTITYDGSNHAVLALDGTAAATSTTTFTPGTAANVDFTIGHPAYATPLADQPFTQGVTAGGTYVVANAWGPAARAPIEFHRTRLDTARAAGAPADSEVVSGSSLAILGATWVAQMCRMIAIADRLGGTTTIIHHLVGIAGYDRGSYLDLPGTAVSIVSQSADSAAEDAVFFNQAMHGSILESASVQQASGNSALSTVKLIDQAVGNGLRIYDATQANYGSAVAPNLVACSAFQPSFQAAVNAGDRLILPANCNLNENDWTGAGFFVIAADASSVGAAINGDLAGGFPSVEQALLDYVNKIFPNTAGPVPLKQATGSAWPEPIDMTHGHYLYERVDIDTGAGPWPFGLSFRRLYSSGLRTSAGPLGNGWTHGFATSVTVGSDGFQGMGEDSALDAIGAIVEMMVAHDLVKDAARPLDKMVVATLGQRWFGEQLLDNTVIVRQGLNGEVFVKLADGTYNAPPGNSNKLTRNGDDTYALETARRSRLNFNLAGHIATHVDPSGVQVNFTYTGNDLTQIQNSLGRTLTLAWSGGRVTGVGDGTRSIGYGYDGSGNLASFTDATAAITTFQYDLPGRLTSIFYPANPGTPFVTNTYDTLGRVQTQSNARGKVWTYFFAGTRSEEVAPDTGSTVTYVNARGNILKAVDPLGRVVQRDYDGQSRLTRVVLPEGNGTEYEYDDVPCLAQLRCTHNVKTLRKVPKPASGQPTLTSAYTYESAFNRIASSTDPRGNTYDVTYTAQGNLLQALGPPATGGVRPQIDYAYTAFSPPGFPDFVLLTKVTTLIAPGDSVDNAITYNTGNRYVPATRVVDAGSGKLNLTTTYAFDATGNLTQVDGRRTDVADITGFSYDAERRLTQVTDATGKQTTFGYDADGRLLRSSQQVGAQWLVQCRTWSTSGQVVTEWGPALTGADTACPVAAAPVAVLGYEYDDLDRVVKATTSLAPADGGNRVSQLVYGLDGRIQSAKRGVGTALEQTEVAFTYTPNGLPASMTDARSNRMSYAYDGLDRRIRMSFPDKAIANTSSATDFVQYTYDENGNLATARRRNGQVVTYTRDNLNRLTGRTYANAADNVTLSYDLMGRLVSASFADLSHDMSFAWDHAGRLTSSTAGGKTLGYQYDPAGNRIRTTWPEGAFFVTTDYDALNRPTAVKELGATTLAAYGYDDLSRRTTTTFGNSTTTNYGYDNNGNLATLAHDLAGTAQDVTLSYTRNQVQDITGIAASNPMYEWSNAAPGNTAYVANGLNQYTSVGGIPHAYDGSGNLTGAGLWSYTYDTDNRLRSATGNGTNATLGWDPAGRLRQTTIDGAATRLLYDGRQLIAEYDGAGQLLRRYVRGAMSDETLVRYEGTGTAGKSWFYGDHLGSIVATADGGGNSTSTLTYGPFGERGQTSPARFGYTGQQFIAPLELYHYKARFYSPVLGRFLQPDPIGVAGGMNAYDYVSGNPVNATDPSGMAAHVSVVGNKVYIQIPITWGIPTAGSKGLVAQIKSDIADTWTGQFGKYSVVTTVIPGAHSDPNTNRYRVIDYKYGRSNVDSNGGFYQPQTATIYVKGQDDRADNPETLRYAIAHETGHILGLDDRYHDAHNEAGYVSDEGFEHNLMGGWKQMGIREEDIAAIIAANPNVAEDASWANIGDWIAGMVDSKALNMLGAKPRRIPFK